MISHQKYSEVLSQESLATSIKLVVLVSHPIQYFVPVYRALALRDGLGLSVVYRTRVGIDSYLDAGFGREVKWNIPLLGGYRSHFLSSKLHLTGVEWSVVTILIRLRPDVLLVHGYSDATNLLGIIVAKIIGSRVLMRGDTRPSLHHASAGWKALLKKMLFHLVDGCVAIGSQNANYYKSLGVPSRRIHFAPFSVDNAVFDLGSARVAVREEQRRQMDISPDAKVVLFASKLIARKRAHDLLEAMKIVGVSHKDAVLVVAGSGPEEACLRESVAGMDERIRFVGFKNQDEMPSLLAAADVFVLPSEAEPWGLIVNEAMAAGLPVIVSDDVGAAPDLVEGKGTGLVYPAGDVARLVDALEIVLGSSDTRRCMGGNSLELIKKWNVSASAAGIENAVLAVVKDKAVR